MIRVLHKTTSRTLRFLADALAWRASERPQALVAWGLIAGLVWLIASLAGDPSWSGRILLGCYLLVVLAAICAIDARYGIIPDSLVIALAVGGLLQPLLSGEGDLTQQGLEAVLVFVAACLFGAAYRWLRGQDGWGFGDVKFLTVAVLWIGIEGLPELLLAAVLSALASLVILKLEGYDLHAKQAISFGPHLAVGLWLAWLAGRLQFGL
ncbi:MAG: A24 family peptidase [Bradyrhizobium sp.]